MIRQQQAGRAQRVDAVDQRDEARRVVEVGHRAAELAAHLRQHRAAEAVAAGAEVGEQQGVAPRRCSSGVTVPRTSGSDANAVTTSDTGAVTCFCVPSSSVQRVRIDSESLPTGTAIPSAGHSSIATACTVS